MGQKMKGKLLVISGLSAAGKGTIAKELINRNKDYVLSISATSRDKRKGEEEGVHYFFVSKDKFEDMISNGELLEYAKYVDNYYGTPKKYVLDKLDEGINVILEIEMQGALQVKKIFSDAILVYLIPPSAKEQYNRLTSRGRENKSQVLERLKQAIIDASYAPQYDYILVNDTIEKLINDVNDIVEGKYNKEKNHENILILNKLVDDIKGGNYV